MKLFVLCLLSFYFTVFLYSQSDPFVFRINGEEVSRTEFEVAYQTHRLLSECANVNDYLQQFIDRKLKIAEAKNLRIDTIPEYRAMILGHEREIDENLLSIIQTDKSLWEQYSEQQKSLPQPGKIKVMHIFKAMPQNSTSSEQERIIRSMDVLYAQLSTDTSACFSEYVDQYSEDKRCFEFGWLETYPDFEQVVFSMQEGEISKPFITPSGIHIAKVIAKKKIPSEEDLSYLFRLRLMRKYKSGRDLSSLQHLKDKLNYTPDLRCIDELLSAGHVNGVLFTLDGREYTGADFRSFAEDNPKGVKRQFDDFVASLLFNTLLSKSDQTLPYPGNALESAKEEFLISEITRREIGNEAHSTAGLTAYFSVHKKEYDWEYPRFKGVVLHAKNKRQYRSAKKLVRKMPFEDWKPIITTYFNSDGEAQVEVEQGIFALGDNAFVDELAFKNGHASPHHSFPSAFVIGKKIKGPESYHDVREKLQPAYENFLEKQWLKHLRERYRVEINEEVLKTVNNN